MKQLIKDNFYDKNVEFYTYSKGVSSDGGRSKGGKEVKGSIDCNVHQTINKHIKEQYGIDNDAKLMITCAINEDVEKGYLFKYKGHEYEVNEILYLDSHLKVICI